MIKDPRYENLKNLIESGHIKTFLGITNTVPKTTIAMDLGMHPQTFNKFLNDPGNFTLTKMADLASLIGTKISTIADIVFAEYNVKNKAAKMKRRK